MLKLCHQMYEKTYYLNSQIPASDSTALLKLKLSSVNAGRFAAAQSAIAR